MRKLTLLLLLLMALIACSCAVAGDGTRQGSVQHGSLVIAMPVASGWVVCGDKRRTNSVFAGSDDEVKVFEVTKAVIAGMTGLRRVNENNQTYFDVAERVKAFVKANRFDGRREYIETLARSLGDDFVRLVPRRIWLDVEKIEIQSRTTYTVMLFWVTPSGLPQWGEATFNLRGGPTYAARSTRESIARSNQLRPIVMGNLGVVDELQNGHSAAFDEVRQDSDVRWFLRDRYMWRERSEADAERFGRRIIALTSERLPELDRKDSNVGPHADCERVSRAFD
jgi:hypothetical protein